MTTPNAAGVPKPTDAPDGHRLSDPPPRRDGEASCRRQLASAAQAHRLARHPGRPETTLATAAGYRIAPHRHAQSNCAGALP